MIINHEYNNDYLEKIRYYIDPFKNLGTHQEMVNHFRQIFSSFHLIIAVLGVVLP